MLEQLMVGSGRASRAAERRLTLAAEQQEMLTGLVVALGLGVLVFAVLEAKA
jgi:hypothetical protein